MVAPLTGKTLLIGSGACARRIAEDILTQTALGSDHCVDRGKFRFVDEACFNGHG